MNPLNSNSPFNGPLTPHKFRQQNSSTPQQEAPPQTVAVKRYLPLLIGGFALLILPITIWQLNTQQDIRQRASEPVIQPEQPVAQIDDEVITLRDIDTEYARQQNSSVYVATPTGLRNKILNDLIERKLITDEAKRRNISATDGEIENIQNFLSYIYSKRISIDEAQIEILRSKIAQSISNTTLINAAFSNANTPEMQSFFETLRSQIVESGDLLKAVEPLTQRSKDVAITQSLITYDSASFLASDSAQILHRLNPGEISEVITTPNNLFIFEVVEKTTGELDFREFLEDLKAQHVKMLNPNI